MQPKIDNGVKVAVDKVTISVFVIPATNQTIASDEEYEKRVILLIIDDNNNKRP